MEEVIRLLLQSRDYTHFIHWNTDSYAEHEALGIYYEELIPLVDQLAELYLGYDKKFPIPTSINLPEDVSIVSYLSNIGNAIDAFTRNIAREDIKNVLAEILSLINQTLYRLSLS